MGKKQWYESLFENYAILQNVTKALKKPGKFIFTTLNGLFPLFHSVETFCGSTVEEGNATYRNNNFDLMTFRDHNITDFEDDQGNIKSLDCNERYYVPSEVSWLLKSLGIKKLTFLVQNWVLSQEMTC